MPRRIDDQSHLRRHPRRRIVTLGEPRITGPGRAIRLPRLPNAPSARVPWRFAADADKVRAMLKRLGLVARIDGRRVEGVACPMVRRPGEDRSVHATGGKTAGETDGPPYCYDYPRPAVTVDLAIFALSVDGLRVLLIRRKHPPFEGRWALPGGFLEIDEPIEAGARRELREETRFDASGPIAFLGAYGDPGRDPRGRTISLAHVAVIRGGPSEVGGGDDASEAAWRLARAAGPLAFDHDAMLNQALDWLASGVRRGNLGLDLLPEEFDESEIKQMFRSIFRSPVGAAQWLRRMERANLVEPRAGSGRLYHAVKQES